MQAETPCRQGSLCFFTHPRAQLICGASPTVSLAHHGLASEARSTACASRCRHARLRGARFKFLTRHKFCFQASTISMPVVRLWAQARFEIPPRRQDQNANNRSTKKEDEIHWQYQTRSGCSSPRERSIPYAPPITNHQSHLTSHFSRLGSQDRLGGSAKLIPRLYRHGKS